MSWGHGWWGFGPWGVCSPSGPDFNPPVISDQVPAPGDIGVGNNAKVIFRLSDGAPPDAEHTGIDFSSIRVLITQGSVTTVAFEFGQFKFGYTGIGSFVGANNTGGFDFIVDPSFPWAIGSTVTVYVECVDGNCNAISFTWSFSVGVCIVEPCEPITSLVMPSIGGWGIDPWGTLPWGGGGPGTLIPVTGGGVPIIATFSPPTGTTLGGTDFIITGTDLACFAFNDIFSDAVVDPLLWWVMGAGTTVEGPFGLGGELQCSVPATAGTITGVLGQALKLKTDFHVEVEYTVKTFFTVTKPSSEVVLAALRAEFDSGNYVQISYVMKGPTAVAGTIRCEVWKLGVLTHISETDTTAMSGKFGLMRYFDPVYNDNKAAFWWNGMKILDVFDCPSCTMQFSYFVRNNAAAYAIETWFDNFVSHSVVAFIGPSGTDVATNVVEVSELKLRGKTPPTIGAWAGPVSIRVTNGSGNGCEGLCEGCFTYQFPDAFVVGRTEPYRPTRKELSIVDDGILRNPNQNIGHGLRRQI